MRVRFADFVLDTERRELTRGGANVSLRPKVLQLLETLVVSRPKAIAQEELHDRLWPNTFVTNGLHKLIHQLRNALGDDEHTIIRTVYGFGFAFAAVPFDDERKAYCQVVIGDAEFDLREGENLIGRERGAAVRIDALSISRRHARIVVAGGQVTIEDLRSKNGTFVRGTRVHRQELRDGDAILFGIVPATFRVLPAGQSTETAL